jgi:hypothetical protein
MPSSDLPEVFAAQILFWILLPIVLFAPLRWGVLAWLIMGNLDTTGPGQSVSTAFGWINAAKGVIIPIYLLWRLRSTPSVVMRTLPARSWILLTAYACIAIFWAPVALPGLKLVGNMVGILLSVVVLEKSSRRDLLDSMTLIILVVVSLSLGVVQTYYYGGLSYGFDGSDQPARFSSFLSAQQYAAFLVGFLAILLWRAELNRSIRAALCLGVLAALVVNGSRVWFFGAALVLIIYFWSSIRRTVSIAAFAITTLSLLVLLLVNVNVMPGIELNDSSNRIMATASALITGTDTSHNVGLRDLNFRSRVYEGVLSDLADSSLTELIIGHGTSTGGNAMLHAYPGSYRSDSIDPNRVIHNEWLRAAYEWGAAGVLLLLVTVSTLFFGLASKLRSAQVRGRVLPALSFAPAFIAALSTENVLAGAGNAVTLGLALTLAILWSPAEASPARGGYVLVRANCDPH